MKLDKSKLSQIFARLLECKSPQEMEEVFVPVEYRKLNWDSIADQAQAAVDSGDLRRAVRLLYSCMVLALKGKDWLKCYAFAALAYYHSAQVSPETLAETIATMWPILAYCETHCPKGPQPSNVARSSQILVEEGRKAERLDDRDMIGMIALALGGLSIFHARVNQMIGLPTADSPKAEAMEAAMDLEYVLGLIGVKDWVNKNFR